ncbi:outer membrane receptor for ferric coprogen and ferric-rhodotorulic acid [Agrobacterium vitis]|nr:outer membrane receptor for ferric coprogen and ferric-rhodotorulic acid [Agrobacterium vitis]MBE1440206.1 outer membrane receptor for ferric coprogen and ferric-rhodotorulic acid [Agrobacterium vitis]
MQQTTRKNSVAILFATTALVFTFHGIGAADRALAQTAAQINHRFDISAKPVRQAMNEIVRITGIDVIFAGPALLVTGNPVSGQLTVQNAISALLRGTGLTYRFSNANTVIISAVDQEAASGLANGSSTLLEPIVIRGQGPITEGTGAYTTGAMATATGFILSPRETPQSVSVMTSQRIKDQSSTTIQDALKKTTGINVIRDSGVYRFQSRGFFMDQMREDGINFYGLGSPGNVYRNATSLSDLEIYDRVEILRGPTGLMQGTGEPGGTINLVRKRPTEEFQAESTTSVGSWDTYRQTVDVSGSLNKEKTVRGRGIIVGEKGDSFKDYTESWKGTAHGTIEADVGENTMLTVGGLYQKSDETPDFYGVPMLADGTSAGLDRSTYLGADWNRLEREKRNVYAELGHYLNDDWKLDLKANYTTYDSRTVFSGLTTSSGLASNGLARVNNMLRYDNESDQLGLEAKLSGKFELFGREHDLYAALNYNRSDFQSRFRNVYNRSYYNIYTFKGSDLVEPDWNGALYNDITYDYLYSEAAASLGTRLALTDEMHAILGGRFTHYEYESRTHYVTYNGSPDGEIALDDGQENKFIPYLGLTYDIHPGVTLYASYANIFQPQSATDVNGEILDPVEGENYEIGVKTELADGRVQASFALFQIDQKNRAIYDAAALAYFPEGAVRSRGFEVELSGELTYGWNLFAGYTFNRSKYLETESSSYREGMSYSPSTPTHMFRLSTTYRLPVDDEKWTIGGGVRVQSGSESIYGIKQSGYAVWDASLKYDFNDTVTLQLAANNIFDTVYYENNRVRTVNLNNLYGDPRNFTLTLTKKF